MPFTFHDFCQQVGAAACPYLERCELVDPDAGSCEAVLGISAFGCSAQPEAELNAGLRAFDPDAGHACLAAMSAAPDCSAGTQASTATTCAGVLRAAVAQGGICHADADCIPPTPGAQPSPTFGCDSEDLNDPNGCTYVCSYGKHLGEQCGSGLNGSACVEGNCAAVTLDGGATQYQCIAVAPIGGDCQHGSDCADANAYCDPFTATCQLLQGPGGACEPTYCAQEFGCPCAPGSYCNADLSDGGGTCTLPVDGGDCSVQGCNPNQFGDCPCTQLPGTFCQAPTDGGDVGACVPTLPDGSSCTGTCGYGGGLCACGSNSLCIDDDGGGGICTARAPGGVGAFCYPGQCLNFGDPSCRCDLANHAYCNETTQTCDIRIGDGGACDRTSAFACEEGFTCSQSVCVPSTGAFAGAPCDLSNGVWCQPPLVCSESSGPGSCVTPGGLGDPCYANAGDGCFAPYVCTGNDGGFGTCTGALAVGANCLFLNTPCRDLLTCDLRFLGDGGLAASCVPQSAVGGPCDPGEPSTCANGYCDGTTCQAFASFGDPCDPNAPVCAANLTCIDNQGNGNFICLDQCPSAG
ncbi:MAG: hypothetical protein JST54_27205 [Deltaproteobacteria bacterium]|nr:hypothetical protein [Deltaproteobacteria bacterium]